MGAESEMAEDKVNTEPAPILSLEQYRDQLHPHALERYHRFLGEVRDLLLSGQLTEGELKLYLSQEEQIELGTFEREIAEWLAKCRKDSGKASLSVYPYSMSHYYSMSAFKTLLETAVERKVEKARREAGEKERQGRKEAEKKKWWAAQKEINLPLDDAGKYLTDEEQQQFIASTIGAVDAYLGVPEVAKGYHPDIWQLLPSAADYVIWTGIIAKRKKEEAHRRQAEIEYSQFVKEVSHAIKKVQQELIKEKKPNFTCPSILVKYHPDVWCELELPTDKDIRAWARPQILKVIPQVLTPFVSIVITPQLIVIPRTEYQSLGCPCLTWHFDIYVAARVDLHLKASTVTREYYDWKYSFSLEATKLGTMYLGYCQWESEQGFSTPLALLRLIVSKDSEGPGIEILNQSSERIVYIIDGYEENFVELQKGFINYIRSTGSGQPLVEALLAQGLIDKDTAKLIGAKWDEPLPVTVKASAVSSPDLAAVTAKLMELGWAEPDVKYAVETATVPENTSTEDVIKTILQKSHGGYA